MSENNDYAIGFDMGGTKMLAAVLNAEYEVVAKNKEKTPSEAGNEEVFASIVECVDEVLEKAGVKRKNLCGIGIAIPGPIDVANGIVYRTPNLGLLEFPLRDRLSEAIGVPVVLENDVNAGVYGEFVKGCARGFLHVVGLFPGTGIGGGLILDGKLYRGSRGAAGEIGHTIVQTDGPLCGCGSHGCLESVASRTAIAKDVIGLAASGKAPYVFENAGTDIRKVKSGTLLKAIEAGDTAVADVVYRAADFLGIGMANCVNIFNPEIIVLGGGLVEKFGAEYIARADTSMRRHAMSHLVADVRIKAAILGDYAAIIGAAALVRELGKTDAA
ncbi:MAG: ROK family protein [Spirochaetaceae bacterium]|nr:MAG: ROK family protein [Spirochaetaceae bacterium]